MTICLYFLWTFYIYLDENAEKQRQHTERIEKDKHLREMQKEQHQTQKNYVIIMILVILVVLGAAGSLYAMIHYPDHFKRQELTKYFDHYTQLTGIISTLLAIAVVDAIIGVKNILRFIGKDVCKLFFDKIVAYFWPSGDVNNIV